MEQNWIIGIDIGGTNFRIGAVSPAGELAQFRKVPVGSVFGSGAPLEDLAAYLAAYRAELGTNGIAVQAAAIGFPATLDRARQRVVQAPNIPFMENLPVVEVLQQRLGMPVFIERDVVQALYYDQAKYQLPEQGVTVGIYFGTGVGNVIMIDGVPLAGKNGASGELGHIPVDGSTVPCGCGNIGCLENLAGGKYLAHLCQTTYQGTPIGRLFAGHGTEPLLEQFVDRMAMAVATEVNILDPDYVLIGGGVPQMESFPKERLLERILFHARKPYPAQDLAVIFTDDEEAKCVLGAARYAARRLAAG